MITREDVVIEIQKVPKRYLEELYRIIKDFEERRDEDVPDQNVMAALRNIRISASKDFSIKANLYDRDEKDAR